MMRFRLSPMAEHGTPEVHVAELARLREHEPALQVVDVREAEEWAVARIPGATHIPLGELGLRKRELDAQRPVVAVCRSGRRSLTAADALKGAGFVEVASLAGGLLEWAETGLPVER